jgi:tight adherence protein B
VLRERRKMSDKIKAVSMEAKASAGIIGALPFTVALLTYLASPNYISILWKTDSGKISLVIGGVWMSIGIVTMKKMINFKF